MDPASDSVGATELGLDDIPFADLRLLLDYWNAKRGSRFAPPRSDIDPLEIRTVLPRIMLAEVSRDPLDFTYRLAGTGICNMHHTDPTGRSVRSLTPPAYGALIWSHYKDCVERRAPLLHHITLDSWDQLRSYARLILPLSDDGIEVTKLMTLDSDQKNVEALSDYFEASLPVA